MKKLLIVVDYQNDFVSGPLGFPQAPTYYGRILSLIHEFSSADHDIVFTRDLHDDNYLHTEEGRNLPVPHCMRGTDGAHFYGDLEKISAAYPVFEKDTFGSKDLGKWLSNRDYDEIVLVGVDLSICVLANAVIAKTMIPSAHLVVDLSASGTGDHEAEKYAVEELRRLQIEVRDLSEPMKPFWPESK
jgi:nicotinamidase-related amidase